MGRKDSGITKEITVFYKKKGVLTKTTTKEVQVPRADAQLKAATSFKTREVEDYREARALRDRLFIS